MRKKLASGFALLTLLLVMSPALPAYEPHPEIRAALEALHNAKAHLEEAAHDFHGHRVEAIKHVDAAIHEAEICMHED
jgi:hypothetical protein